MEMGNGKWSLSYQKVTFLYAHLPHPLSSEGCAHTPTAIGGQRKSSIQLYIIDGLYSSSLTSSLDIVAIKAREAVRVA